MVFTRVDGDFRVGNESFEIVVRPIVFACVVVDVVVKIGRVTARRDTPGHRGKGRVRRNEGVVWWRDSAKIGQQSNEKVPVEKETEKGFGCRTDCEKQRDKDECRSG